MRHGLGNPRDLLASASISPDPEKHQVHMYFMIHSGHTCMYFMIHSGLHLNNLGVVVNTATLEGFLDLEPCLRDGTLLYDWVVVRILAGHLS